MEAGGGLVRRRVENLKELDNQYQVLPMVQIFFNWEGGCELQWDWSKEIGQG